MVTTWMDLEDTLQSEISQSQNGKYCTTPPIGGIKKTAKHRVDDSVWWLPGEWAAGCRESL